MLRYTLRTAILILLIAFSATFLVAECKLMALIGQNNHTLTDVTVITYYPSNPTILNESWADFTQPCINQLQRQGGQGSSYPNNNPHGWGIVSYEGSSTLHANLWRNEDRYDTYQQLGFDMAWDSDPDNSNNYELAIQQLKDTKPRIVLGHVRRASDSNTNKMSDPHPFLFEMNGKEFAFIHNGGVNIAALQDLIGSDWFNSHPIHQYHGNTVDSELYFYWLMKNIELANGDILAGLRTALNAMYSNNLNGAMNFVLTDGKDLYAYRYMYTEDTTHPLTYFYDIDNTSVNHYFCGVMSIFPDQFVYPTNTTRAHAIANNELVYFSATGNIVRLPEFASNPPQPLS